MFFGIFVYTLQHLNDGLFFASNHSRCRCSHFHVYIAVPNSFVSLFSWLFIGSHCIVSKTNFVSFHSLQCVAAVCMRYNFFYLSLMSWWFLPCRDSCWRSLWYFFYFLVLFRSVYVFGNFGCENCSDFFSLQCIVFFFFVFVLSILFGIVAFIFLLRLILSLTFNNFSKFTTFKHRIKIIINYIERRLQREMKQWIT